MKKFKLIYFFLLLFLLNTNVFAKIENKIILKVQDQIISTFDVKNKIISSLIVSNQLINQENINEIKNQSLDSIININLKKAELSKYSYEINIVQLDNYLNSISSNDIEGLKKKFIINNIDFEIFLEEIKTELKWQILIYNKFNNKIKIDEKSVNDEIQRILSQQNDVVEYKISEIEILSVGDEADKNKILEIKKQIKEIGFESTAIAYSISTSASNKGNLGWINSKSLSENFYKKINKMQVNDVSEPILSQDSLIMLKLVDKRSFKKSDINKIELKKKIIDQKKNELFNLYSKSYLSKIKNTSFIEYK